MAITKVRGLQQIESGSIGGLQLTGSIANEGIKHVYGSGSDGHSGSLQLDTTFTPTFAGVSSSAGIDVGVTGALSESRFGGYVHIEGSLPMSQSDGTIRDIGLLVDSNISFTPNDCAVIWESLDNIIEEYGNEELENLIENISPDNIFNEKDNKSLLTLTDSKKYEELLKENIVKINKINPIIIDRLLNEYNIDYISPKTEDSILKMLRKLKKDKMFPMLLFNPDENICENLFDYIYDKLHLNELTRTKAPQLISNAMTQLNELTRVKLHCRHTATL